MTHEERAKRRGLIAAECQSAFLEDVAERYGVAIQTVQHACREHQVVFKRRRKQRAEATETAPFLFAVLRDLLDGGWGVSEIAERQGITAQRVSQIEEMACDACLLAPRNYAEGTKRIYRKEKA